MSLQPGQSSGGTAGEDKRPRQLNNPDQNTCPSTKTESKPKSLRGSASTAMVMRPYWGKNIIQSTAYNFLAGASLGAAGGLISGCKSIEATDTRWLKISRILNGCSQTSRRVGGFCGVAGLIFTGMGRALDSVSPINNDLINTGVAGVGTLALSYAVSGPRSAVAKGMLCGLAIGITYYCHATVRFNIRVKVKRKDEEEKLGNG